MLRFKMKGYVFYFDLMGMRARLIDDLGRAVRELEEFQRLVRARTEIHIPGGTVITLADNVWARIHEDEPDAVVSVVRETLRAASEVGFDAYFGVVTFGMFEPDISDSELWTGGDPTDIRKQHIGMTSDPHLRAAMAEKWSAALAKAGTPPAPISSIWVSEEVPAHLFGSFRKAASFDLAGAPLGGKAWPFGRSKFNAYVGS